jgi:hypothetical protein
MLEIPVNRAHLVSGRGLFDSTFIPCRILGICS